MLSYAGMVVAVANNTVDLSGDVASPDITNNRAICAAERVSMGANPIVVFYGRFDTTVLWNSDAHSRKELSRVF